MEHVSVTWASADSYLLDAFSRQSATELPTSDDRYHVVKVHEKLAGKWFELRGSRSTAQVQLHRNSTTVDIYFYHLRR